MGKPINILHLEDEPFAAELVRARIEAEGIACRIVRVDDRHGFVSALDGCRYDLILADYSLPSFDGMSALRIAREKCPETPYIFISGHTGEDIAVEALKSGATDYVLKDRLSRLAPAVRRALREAEEGAMRRRAEKSLRKINRVHAVLSAVNHLIIRAGDRKELFEGVCRIAVEDGLFRMAWVGLADEAAMLVRPAASSGCEDGYLEDVTVSTEDIPEGSGPTGSAVRTGWHFINNDTETNPMMLPWREEALRRGYRSSAAFPLAYDGRTVGALTVYAAEPGFFDGDEVRLLDNLAADISYAMRSMKQEGLRQKAEAEAHELDEKLQRLVEEALVGVYILQDGRYVYVNPRLCEMLGYSKEELVGNIDVLGIVHPDDMGLVRENLRRRLEGEVKSVRYELRMLRKDGGVVFVEALGSFTFYQGRPSIIGTALDITERRRAEEEVGRALDETRRREAEVSALFKGAQAILRSREFPETAREIFTACKELIGARAGYVALLSADGSENEVVYLDPGGLGCAVDPSLPMPIRGLRGEAYRLGGPVYDNDFQGSPWMKFMPDGHAPLENVLFAPLMIEGRAVGLLGLGNKRGGFTDDDARMAAAFGDLAAIALGNSRTLESLETSEERFRSVAQTAGDAIITVDGGGTVIFWNQAAERIFGYASGQAVGRHVSFIMPERYRQEHASGLGRAAQDGKTRLAGRAVELVGLRAGGAEFPMELSLAAWSSREGTFFTSIIRDITERKKLDRQKADFYAMVTHDIKTPLTTIMGYSELALMNMADNMDARLKDAITAIYGGGSRLNTLVEDFLSVSRMEAGMLAINTAPADLAGQMRDAKKEMEPAAREKGLSLELEAAEPLPPVVMDKKLMHRAVSNLIQNALNYTPPGGKVTLRVEKEDGSVVISVSDDGPGIPAEEQPRVFDKYYRSQRTAGVKGSGLGLAIVKAVAEAHGGRVELTSEAGKGCTFRLIVPLAPSPA